MKLSPADHIFEFVSFFFFVVVLISRGVQIPGTPALRRLISLLSHVCDVMPGRIDEVLEVWS